MTGAAALFAAAVLSRAALLDIPRLFGALQLAERPLALHGLHGLARFRAVFGGPRTRRIASVFRLDF